MSNPVEEAITSRRSVRAYLDKPVPRETIERILDVSSRAPSGTNTQPWRVRVLTGEVRDRLCEAAVYAHSHEPEKLGYSYTYYPAELPEPYISRRRKVGWDLYGLLDIKKGEREKTHKQHARNFKLFDAPVGLIFTIETVMEQGSWLDFGMFIQNVMVAARAHGLHTCPQAAWVQMHRIVIDVLDIPDNEEVVCGMALGYEDTSAIENTLRTEREPVAGFTQFLGFEKAADVKKATEPASS